MHSIKIRQIAETTSGGTPLRLNKEYYSGGIPWLKSGELNDGYIFSSEEHINEEAIRKSSAKIFSKGTLLIALYGATIGKTGILGINAATNQAICSLIPKQNNSFHPYYLQQQFIYNRKKLISRSVGGAQPNISQDIIKDFELIIHPYPEQAYIANILSTVDEAIQKADEAITKTERIKHAMMQKLLTEGIGHKEFKQTKIGTIPKDWEISSVESLFSLSSGTSRPKEFSETKNDICQVPIYGGNGILGYTNKANISTSAIIIGRVGEYCGAVHFAEGKSWITDNALYTKEIFNPEKYRIDFLRVYLEFLKLNRHKKISGQPLITQTIINNLKIPIPSKDEQNEIMKFYLEIVNCLKLKLSRKMKLEKIKQGLMDDLLTGKKRIKIN